MYLHLLWLCSYLIACTCTSTGSAFLLSTYTSTASALSPILTLVSTLLYPITVTAFTLPLKVAQRFFPNAIVAQSQNCPFGVNTKIQLKNITKTSDNTSMGRGVFQLTRMPVLSDVLIYLSSIAVLTPHDKFWVVLVLLCRYSPLAGLRPRNLVLASIAFGERYNVCVFWNVRNP